MPTYYLSGCAVSTDTPLEIAQGQPQPNFRAVTLECTVCVQRPAPSEWLVARTRPGESTPWLKVGRRGSDLHFCLRDAGDIFVSSDVRRIVIHQLPDLATGVIEHALVDQVLPQVMGLLGRVSFHGSAVSRDGVDVFLGNSGSGKSTLAAYLTQQGGLLMGDDGVCIDVDAEPPMVLTSSATVRLWSDSRERFFDRSSASGPKSVVAVPGSSTSATLKRIFLLGKAEPGSAPQLKRLARGPALGLISHHVDRLFPDDREAMHAEFERLQKIVSSVPTFELAFAHDYESLAAIDGLLREETPDD